MFNLRCALRILSPLVFIGCFHPPLRVRRETLGAFALPSEQLKTPDPRRQRNLTVERLIAHWNLPRSQWRGAVLIAQVRFGNAEWRKFNLPLERKKSYWQHCLTGREYRERGSIDSYCVEIWRKGVLIAANIHPMWINPVPIFED